MASGPAPLGSRKRVSPAGDTTSGGGWPAVQYSTTPEAGSTSATQTGRGARLGLHPGEPVDGGHGLTERLASDQVFVQDRAQLGHHGRRHDAVADHVPGDERDVAARPDDGVEPVAARDGVAAASR